MLTAKRQLHLHNIWSRNIFPFSMEGCVLYLPLWQEDMQGTTLISYDQYHHSCTKYGAIWTPQGRTFDGLDNYIEIPASSTQLNFTSENFSIVACVYPEVSALEDRMPILWRGSYQVDGYGFTIMGVASPYLFFETFQSGVRQLSSSTVFPLDEWYTMGVSRTGASVLLYVDGIDVTDTSGTHINPTTCDRTALIGIHPNKVDWPLHGKVGSLFTYSGVALSAAQHLGIHEALEETYQ